MKVKTNVKAAAFWQRFKNALSKTADEAVDSYKNKLYFWKGKEL